MWEYNNTDELCHYGVKGMKWGVRRNARVLASGRRNIAVKRAKQDYRHGKISSEDRDRRIRSANAAKKDYLAKTKSDLKSITDKTKAEKMKRRLSDQADRELGVNRATAARTVHTLNRVFTGLSMGTKAVNTAVLVGSAATAGLLSPALAAGTLGSIAINTAADLGLNFVRGKIVDRMT